MRLHERACGGAPLLHLPLQVGDGGLGDLRRRRGRVLAVEPRSKGQIIKAQVPLAEVLKYAPDLTSMTSGRGSFSMELSHYEEVPAHLAEKIISASKVTHKEE